MDNDKELLELITKLYSEMQIMKHELNNRIDSLDNRINAMHYEMNDRFNNLEKEISNLISIDAISKSLGKIKEDINELKLVTKTNSYDIALLKASIIPNSNIIS